MRVLILLLLLAMCMPLNAREWRSMKHHKKATGKEVLAPGNWLKKDRKHNTTNWIAANKYNLDHEHGYEEYSTFGQKRDFYKWFDNECQRINCGIHWQTVAYKLTAKLSYLDSWFVRDVIVWDKEFVCFMDEASNLIIKNIFPKLKRVYSNGSQWNEESCYKEDSILVYREQCAIVDSLYRAQSPRVLNKLNRIAHGKGVYGVFIPKHMRFKGDIKNCEDRAEYGIQQMRKYYPAND